MAVLDHLGERQTLTSEICYQGSVIPMFANDLTQALKIITNVPEIRSTETALFCEG
jgi:hypothetical protein